MQEYFAVTDQTQIKLDSILSCLTPDTFASDDHFRGFRPTFSTENGDRSFTFGGMDPAIDDCTTFSFTTDEYQKELEVYSDDTDLKGFILINSAGAET